VDLDTALLRAFVTTVEENHFGRAAQRLFLSQQALSKRIRRLEELLGVRLFERTTRRVELTAAGQRLLPAARTTVNDMDGVAAAVGPRDGPLRVDVMYEQLSILRLVRQAAEREPLLRLEVSSRDDPRTVFPALRRGDIDVAFGRAMGDPWPEDISRRPALLEPVGLLVAVGHPAAGLARVPTADLASMKVWFPTASAPRDWLGFLEQMSQRFGFDVEETLPSMGFEDFLERTATDAGIATLFGLAMRPPTDPRLRVVPLVDPVPVFAWSAMWRRRIPDALVDVLVAGLEADDAVSLGAARDPEQTWLPDDDRAYLVRWLSSTVERRRS
jgi:DNA-binding transcriptional LysR family regulator